MRDQLISYKELCDLKLDPHAKIEVHQFFNSYTYIYISTYRWVTSIYRNFIKNNEIMFKIM